MFSINYYKNNELYEFNINEKINYRIHRRNNDEYEFQFFQKVNNFIEATTTSILSNLYNALNTNDINKIEIYQNNILIFKISNTTNLIQNLDFSIIQVDENEQTDQIIQIQLSIRG